MTETNNVNGVRRNALDRIDRTQRNYRLAFFGAAVIESAFIVGFFLLADLSNRTHLLLLVATVAVYTILALGLVALGIHMSRNTLRVLNAIDLLERRK